MVTRPMVLAVLCVGVFLILQSFLPKTMAFNSNIDRYMMEDQKTQRRKNYMVQRERKKDYLANPEGVITYENEPLDPDRNPDELSAFIVDYANMIRDDVILLDKSVETRTRKRGNIQVKTRNNNQAITPCTWKYNQEIMDLGNNVYPQHVPIKNCSRSQEQCVSPYECKENTFNLPIFRKNPGQSSNSNTFLYDLEKCMGNLWFPDKLPISVGCYCTGDWIKYNG